MRSERRRGSLLIAAFLLCVPPAAAQTSVGATLEGTVSSGQPVNPLTGLDSNRSFAFPLSSRPLGFERDTLSTPTLAMVDLRVLKANYFSPQKHLDLVVESFDLLNHTNVSLLNPFFGPGSNPLAGFARPVDAYPARQIEFSIDLEY